MVPRIWGALQVVHYDTDQYVRNVCRRALDPLVVRSRLPCPCGDGHRNGSSLADLPELGHLADIQVFCHPARTRWAYRLWVYDILSAKIRPNGDAWSFAILAVASTGVVQVSWWEKSPVLPSWLIAVTCVFIICLPYGTHINVYLMVDILLKMSVTPRGDRVPISTRPGCHLASLGFHFLCMS